MTETECLCSLFELVQNEESLYRRAAAEIRRLKSEIVRIDNIAMDHLHTCDMQAIKIATLEEYIKELKELLNSCYNSSTLKGITE